MSASASPALAGKNWLSQLVYVHYVGEKVSSRKWYDKHALQFLSELKSGDKLCTGLIPPEAATDATEGRITKLSAFAIDLGGSSVFETWRQALTHHFIQGQMANGYIFTFEKNKECILFQSCQSPEQNTPAIVVKFINGEKRKRLKTRKPIKTDINPTECTIRDIIKWILETEQLETDYHIANANCQHFASSLWHKFSSLPYPIPAEWSTTSSSPTASAADKPAAEEAPFPCKNHIGSLSI